MEKDTRLVVKINNQLEQEVCWTAYTFLLVLPPANSPLDEIVKKAYNLTFPLEYLFWALEKSSHLKEGYDYG